MHFQLTPQFYIKAHKLVINFEVVSEKKCLYFPQDLLFNCDKYEELRKTLFHKIKSLLCPNVNLNSFKNELNTYLVELFFKEVMIYLWMITLYFSVYMNCLVSYFMYGFGMVTCTVSPLSRFTAHLLPVYRATYKWTSGGILSTT